MSDRRRQLQRAVGQRQTGGSAAPPPDRRREELRNALGVRHLRPGERIDLLHKGKVVGPPWLGGIFQTRLNVGTLVLALGVILFLVWLIMRARVGG